MLNDESAAVDNRADSAESLNPVDEGARSEFAEPTLRFVEPQLVKQGNLADVTAAFFGTFFP